MQDEAPQIWQATLRSLSEAGLPAPQRAFLAQASLVGMLGDTALIAVPDEFTKDIVESRARESLVEALSAQTVAPVLVASSRPRRSILPSCRLASVTSHLRMKP